MQTESEYNVSDVPVSDLKLDHASEAHQKYLFTGIWLILIGAMWILWNMDVLSWGWMERYGLIIVGGLSIVKTIFTKKYHVFFGLTLLMIGGFHLYLDTQEGLGMRTLWPVYFLIGGIALIINFFFNMRRWFSLVAGLSLIGFGGIHISRNFYMFPYDWVFMIRTYWPLTFVVSGIILVGAAWYKHRKLPND